jgi:hypothetical protein
MALTPVLARAFAQLQMVRYRARKNADVPYGGIVERGHEPIHGARITSHHALFEGNSPAETGVEAIGIHEAVRQILGRMTAGAGIDGIASGLAREAPAMLVREIKQVVAVLRRPGEIAVRAEVIETVGRAKLLSSGRG